MGWHGYWASPGDWQTHHSHHPGHQRNSLSVSTPVHSSAAGECGLLPQHNEHRIRSRCSRCLIFCLVFTPARLCAGGQKIIITFLPLPASAAGLVRFTVGQTGCSARVTLTTTFGIATHALNKSFSLPVSALQSTRHYQPIRDDAAWCGLLI